MPTSIEAWDVFIITLPWTQERIDWKIEEIRASRGRVSPLSAIPSLRAEGGVLESIDLYLITFQGSIEKKALARGPSHILHAGGDDR